MAVQFTKLSVSPEVVQTTGTSETAVMSQKAVTDALASAGGGGSTKTVYEINTKLIDGVAMSSNSSTTGAFNKTAFAYKASGLVTHDIEISEIFSKVQNGAVVLFDVTVDGVDCIYPANNIRNDIVQATNIYNGLLFTVSNTNNMKMMKCDYFATSSKTTTVLLNKLIVIE